MCAVLDSALGTQDHRVVVDHVASAGVSCTDSQDPEFRRVFQTIYFVDSGHPSAGRESCLKSQCLDNLESSC